MQNIDSKDYKILNHLFQNSRKSFASIAEKEKIALSVVKYRVEKLKGKGIIIHFNTLIDYSKLGYSMYRFHLILQYASPEMERKIIEHFKSYKYTCNIYSTKGKYDLIVTILKNDSNEFFSFYKETLRKYSSYFRNIYFSQLFEIFGNKKSKLINVTDKNDIDLINNKFKSNNKKVLNIDSIDYNILNLLSENSRISSMEMARKLNVTTTTVIRHIKKLTKAEIILNYSIITDNTKLRYKTFIVYLSLRNYGKISEMIKYLATIPPIWEIYCSLGSWNLEIMLFTTNFEHFILLMDKIQNRYIKDIIDYDYIFLKNIHKTHANICKIK